MPIFLDYSPFILQPLFNHGSIRNQNPRANLLIRAGEEIEIDKEKRKRKKQTGVCLDRHTRCFFLGGGGADVVTRFWFHVYY